MKRRRSTLRATVRSRSRHVVSRRCSTTGTRSASVPIPPSSFSISTALPSGSGSRWRLLSRTSCVVGASRNFDRGALLAPHRALTQTVTGAVLRGDIISPVDGLFAESRHDDDVIAIFVGGLYAPHLAIVFNEPLTPTQPTVILAASELGLAP
jgi:hypothetical protein